MSEKKPVPIFAGPKTATCPVCRKPSYSQKGIHPQCAMKQANAALNQHVAAKQDAKADS
jgi:hypothetical protein